MHKLQKAELQKSELQKIELQQNGVQIGELRKQSFRSLRLKVKGSNTFAAEG